MPSATSAVAGRRFMLGVLAALPVLPTLFGTTTAQAQSTPLASWNDGPAKQAILDFVKVTTDRASAELRAARGSHRDVRSGRHSLGGAPALRTGLLCLGSCATMVPRRIRSWKSREPFKAVLVQRSGRPWHVFSVRRLGRAYLCQRTPACASGRAFAGHRHRSGWQLGEGSALEAALHRADLSADEGGPGVICVPTSSRPSLLPAAARTLCVPTLERVYGIPPRTGHRLQPRHEIRLRQERQDGA